jgi:hypothetical protein
LAAVLGIQIHALKIYVTRKTSLTHVGKKCNNDSRKQIYFYVKEALRVQEVYIAVCSDRACDGGVWRIDFGQCGKTHSTTAHTNVWFPHPYSNLWSLAL